MDFFVNVHVTVLQPLQESSVVHELGGSCWPCGAVDNDAHGACGVGGAFDFYDVQHVFPHVDDRLAPYILEGDRSNLIHKHHRDLVWLHTLVLEHGAAIVPQCDDVFFVLLDQLLGPCIHTCPSLCAHKYIYIYIYIYICMCVRMHTCVCVCATIDMHISPILGQQWVREMLHSGVAVQEVLRCLLAMLQIGVAAGFDQELVALSMRERILHKGFELPLHNLELSQKRCAICAISLVDLAQLVFTFDMAGWPCSI